jgi:O-antigen ligase/Flp pilus assembly protein TadD
MNNLTTYVRYTIISLLFIALLAPFVIINQLFFPFITGKAFFFRIIVEVAALLYLFLIIKAPQYRPKKGPILYAIVSFIAVITVADIFGANFSRSFWSNFERMEGLVSYLHLAVYFLMASTLFRDREWKWFWNSSLVLSICMTFYTFLQLGGAFVINQGGVRVDGTFGNATYLAVYMLFNMFIAAFLFVRGQGKIKYLYAAVFLLDGIALFYTATRGAILGTIFGFFVAGVATAWHSKEPWIRKGAIGGVIVIIAFVGGFMLVRNSSFVQNSPVLVRFAGISLSDKTTQSRFTIWGMAIKGWKEHPVLGWGQENFNLVFNKYYDPILYSQEQWFDRAHSVFFDWLVAGGALGLLAYLSLFGAAGYVLWKTQKLSFAEKAIIGGLLTGYFIQNLTVFDNLVSCIYFFSFLAFLHSSDRASEFSVIAPVKKMSTIMEDGLLSAAVIVFIAIFYFVNVKPVLASTNLIQALVSHPEGVTKNLEYFKDSIGYNTLGVPEAREQLVQLALQGFSTQGVDPTVLSSLAAYAESEMAAQVAVAPTDMRYSFFLGGLYLQAGDVAKGLEYLKKAETLSPNKQQVLFQLLQAYFADKDSVNALATAKKAYDLAPDFAEAQKWYAAALIFSGQKGEAQKYIDQAYGTTTAPNLDNRFAMAYLAAKDYISLSVFWKQKIAQDPTNSQLHVSYAASLMASGDRSGAIKELQSAASLNPALAQSVDDAVSQIRAGKNPLQ